MELNKRQKEILSIISRGGDVTRDIVARALPKDLAASKATLARDLKVMAEEGLIQSIGNGPSTAYKAKAEHPLLAYIDLDHYFLVESDKREDTRSSFNNEIFSLLPGIVSDSERDELKQTFRSFDDATSQVDKTVLERELERYVIELSWKSSKIEGNTYTLLETERLIKQGIESSNRSRYEAVMILNHKDAFKLILENRQEFVEVKKRDLLELHSVLVKGLDITNGIRKHAVGITGTTYQPIKHESELSDVVDELIDLVNKTPLPLEKAIIASSLIAYIQPFPDGNKRTARMMANAILLAHDHFPLSYRSVDEIEFKKALVLFYETNNVYHVKRLFLDQYHFALKNYFPR